MEKVFRDPIHGLMRFDKEEDRLILDLLESPEVQRLRWIRLLGLNFLVYPGAEHSRFFHSLGTAYLMKRVIERVQSLKRRPEFKKIAASISNYRELLLCTALLHDIGHFPFSHILEEFAGQRHESWTIRLLMHPESEAYQKLGAADKNYPKQIAQIIARTFKPSFAVKLISSQLDVDRMDYLLRDSYYTGVEYGRFDLDWLLHSLRIIEKDGDWELAIELRKGGRTAEGYVLARYYMYQQVYHHKTSRAAGIHVLKILQRASDLLKANEKLPVSEPLRKLLINSGELSPEEFLKLDDVTLLSAFREWANSQDEILSDLCRRLNRRRLFKTLEIQPECYHQKKAKIENLAKRAGFEPKYYIALDRPTDHPYIDDYFRGEAGENIFLVDDNLNLIELAEYSELIDAIRNKTFGINRLCFPEELRESITRLLAS